MELKELLEFIDAQHERLLKYYGSPTKQQEVLARTVKLTEELGELCSEVLASLGDQRKEKLVYHQKDNLSHEFADVIITALLVARSLDLNIEKALKGKMEKINERSQGSGEV